METPKIPKMRSGKSPWKSLKLWFPLHVALFITTFFPYAFLISQYPLYLTSFIVPALIVYQIFQRFKYSLASPNWRALKVKIMCIVSFLVGISFSLSGISVIPYLGSISSYLPNASSMLVEYVEALTISIAIFVSVLGFGLLMLSVFLAFRYRR
jgi:hypothetical protein